MTKITVYKTKNGDIFAFRAKGHVLDEETDGCIYCAAVSAITQTACIGLEDVAKAKPEIKISEADLFVKIPQRKAEDIQCRTIFQTLVLGLKSFDLSNPGKIQIFEEVQ